MLALLLIIVALLLIHVYAVEDFLPSTYRFWSYDPNLYPSEITRWN
jgi:hypothetical protein